MLELEVVTGAGERAVCSPAQLPGLFYAVLAGLGQCAVLVRATLRLVPAPANVRHYTLFYPNGPGWLYYLEAGAYYGSTPPDDQKLTGDLHFEQGTQQINSLGYFDFLDRLAPDVAWQGCISRIMRRSDLVTGTLPLPPGRRKVRPPSGAPRPSPGATGMSPLPIGSPPEVVRPAGYRSIGKELSDG